MSWAPQLGGCSLRGAQGSAHPHFVQCSVLTPALPDRGTEAALSWGHVRLERLGSTSAVQVLCRCSKMCLQQQQNLHGGGGSRRKGQCQNAGDRVSSRSSAPASVYRVERVGTEPREVAAISALSAHSSERGCFQALNTSLSSLPPCPV